MKGNEAFNAFRKSGYRLGGPFRDPSHAIGRLKDPRLASRGFNTLGDLANAINRGVKLDAGNGDVAIRYKGIEVIIDPKRLEIKTFRPAKKSR
mgnify:CR=1 FL=1